MKQRVIVMEGPDRCGKTNIGNALAANLDIPYFKMTTEYENWRKKDGFINALRFDQTYIGQFLKQTKHSCIIDRNYASEFVYSAVFKRDTDAKVLLEVDRLFASFGTTYVLCLRRDYSKAEEDELVPKEKLIELDQRYKEFAMWTLCRVVPIFVDDFNDRLSIQVPYIIRELT